jgi:hypothetical protein
MEDMELAVFDDLTGGAAEDREREEVFVAEPGRPELAALNLGAIEAFLTASDADARGRVAMFPLVEPIEPDGETAESRTAAMASEDGFVFVEADKESFGAGDFEGTTEALRDGGAAVAADFEEAEDIDRRVVAAGADVVDFFKGGAAAFGAAEVVTLEPGVDLTEAAPNVPELIIFLTVGVDGPLVGDIGTFVFSERCLLSALLEASFC